MNANAEISFVDMKGVDACIKEQQDKNKPDPKAYSPWQRFVALKSDYIQNIRFFGNLDFVYKKGEGDEDPSRSYKKDQGRDPLTRLIKAFFISSGGGILNPAASDIKAMANHIKKDPSVIANIMNYCWYRRQARFFVIEDGVTLSFPEVDDNMLLINGHLSYYAKKLLGQEFPRLKHARDQARIYRNKVLHALLLSDFFEFDNASKQFLKDVLPKDGQAFHVEKFMEKIQLISKEKDYKAAFIAWINKDKKLKEHFINVDNLTHKDGKEEQLFSEKLKNRPQVTQKNVTYTFDPYHPTLFSN